MYSVTLASVRLAVTKHVFGDNESRPPSPDVDVDRRVVMGQGGGGRWRTNVYSWSGLSLGCHLGSVLAESAAGENGTPESVCIFFDDGFVVFCLLMQSM